VGLGPTTVVRLESTLAHEDLRYWSGPGGLLSAWAPVRPQSEARASTNGELTDDPGASRACENGRQAWSKVRERDRHGQTSGDRPAYLRLLAPLVRVGPVDTPPRHHQFARRRPIFGRFACRCTAAVVTVPPRPLSCPQVVDNYVDKACCERQTPCTISG
jgi:hypothetical protein